MPELYFAEVAAVLRRDAIHSRYPLARIGAALDRLLTAPVRRVQVRPLLLEASSMRDNVTMVDAVYVVMARYLGAACNYRFATRRNACAWRLDRRAVAVSLPRRRSTIVSPGYWSAS